MLLRFKFVYGLEAHGSRDFKACMYIQLQMLFAIPITIVEIHNPTSSAD